MTMKLGGMIRRTSLGLLYILFLLALAEGGSRLFWTTRGASFLAAHRDLHLAFYPELRPIQRAALSKDDEVFDILMLGASVLHGAFTKVERYLRERLSSEMPGTVRIHNVSVPAHTTRDSYYKYRHLMDKRFELIVVYHGINEVRANNCPPSVYREDYSHYSWYRLVNALEAGTEQRRLVFPYTAEFLGKSLQEEMGLRRYVPRHRPRGDWLEYGRHIKTPGAFRANLEGILRMAKTKGEPVLLMTFSSYIPADYTEEKFYRGGLDYAQPSGLPIELWGKPEHVAAGLSAHNAVVEELARRYDHVVFVDQQRLIPRQGRFFTDVAHLSDVGSERFVANIIGEIRKMVGRWSGRAERLPGLEGHGVRRPGHERWFR